MAYSQEQMDFAHKVVVRLMEILKVCPNVDDKYVCHTSTQKAHTRCVDLMVLLAEITNLPEYLVYLGNNEETKVDPYGWILAYPPAEAIVEGALSNNEKVVDLE
jgi:hypothetical protein